MHYCLVYSICTVTFLTTNATSDTGLSAIRLLELRFYFPLVLSAFFVIDHLDLHIAVSIVVVVSQNSLIR